MERYLAAPYDPALRPDDRLLAFLDKLARNAAIAEWQVHQAEDALFFLFRDVLVRPLEGLQDTVRARRGPKLPVVFSREEVQSLFAVMEGTVKLMAQLTYGAGLRLMECVRLRVKDIDFDQSPNSSCSCSSSYS